MKKNCQTPTAVAFHGLLFLGLLLSALIAEGKNSEKSSRESRPSTVEGVSIANFHLLAEEQGRLYRGAAPNSKVDEAEAIGVNEVIIYRAQKKKDFEKELNAWTSLGLEEANIHRIQAEWQNLDIEEACDHTIEALQIMKNALETKGKSLYFHCTHGEDRTGLLAGLFRHLHDGWTLKKSFVEEMCDRGYEAGSSTKPDFVVRAIRAGLTPLMLKLARLKNEGKLSWQNLDNQVCRGIQDVEPIDAAQNWRCK